MHKQPWPYMDYMDSYTLPLLLLLQKWKLGLSVFTDFWKPLTNINRIIKLLLPRNSAAKIKYIYLISSQNINSKYF